MLGRKQSLTNDDWLKMFENIAKTTSRSHIEALTFQTTKAIQKNIKGRKAAYGWSGGKDSLLLLRALAAYQKFNHTNFELIAITVDCTNGKADFSCCASTDGIDGNRGRKTLFGLVYRARRLFRQGGL